MPEPACERQPLIAVGGVEDQGARKALEDVWHFFHRNARPVRKLQVRLLSGAADRANDGRGRSRIFNRLADALYCVVSLRVHVLLFFMEASAGVRGERAWWRA